MFSSGYRSTTFLLFQYDIGHEDGIEIVIEGADDIISDDTIGQFVQTETDINGAVANVCAVGMEYSNVIVHLF